MPMGQPLPHLSEMESGLPAHFPGAAVCRAVALKADSGGHRGSGQPGSFNGDPPRSART